GLDQGTLLALSAEPDRHHQTGRDVARGMARRAAARHGLRDELLRVQAEILRWAGAAGARSGAWTGGSPPRDLILSDLRRQAAPALVDAAAALLLGAALEERYREVLLAPWEDAVRDR